MRKICLIVDDSSIVRMVARKILESLDFTVAEAENGETALAKVLDLKPDVVLLDCNMPVKSGLEFLEELRRRSDIDQPAVVFCTTENDAVDIETALRGGANEYILKPYDRGILAGKFRQIGLL
ncbi:MAG TPA: response regulator [Kiloniellaceae bacterium]|nr:response regulator [Kiloniellaceae bacterium]